MNKRKVAILLLYDKNKIIMQDRKEISKWGEEYAFFGGAIEKNETPQQALKREIKEELNLNVDELKNLEFFKHYKDVIEKIKDLFFLQTCLMLKKSKLVREKYL